MLLTKHNVLAFRSTSSGFHRGAMDVLAAMLMEHQLTVKILTHAENEKNNAVTDLLLSADLVLLEVEDTSPFITVHTDIAQPRADGDLLFRYQSVDHCQQDFSTILQHLQQVHRASPLWACILIGGKSSRMGRAKHLLPHSTGTSWLEYCVQKVQPHVDNIVLSGAGDVPESLQHLERIEDAPGVVGPLAGIIGASRLQPSVAWLLLACDMPLLSTESIKWLVAQRKIGRWGTVPRRDEGTGKGSGAVGQANKGKKGMEPLFACYERQCGPMFEAIFAGGSLRIRDIADCEKINRATIPRGLAEAWTNVNTQIAFDEL